jgi:uncharacterized protein YbjT (DUF2867 family)
MPTYVVAGATGRVGSVVARELLALGATPRVFVRSESAAREWRGRGAEAAVGSLDDAAALSEALRGVTGFFTLLPENVPPDDFHGARRRMADAIGAAVKAADRPRVVMLSALAAVLPEGSGPAKDLHYCENVLRATGAPVAVLRACYFQENVGAAVQTVLHAGVYPNFLGNADRAIPMIATRDVGRFAADALVTWPALNATVDLFGPTYSIRHVAERLGAALGRPAQVVDVPPDEHVRALVAGGVPPAIAPILAEMFASVAAGRIAPASDRRLTGRTPIDEVIRACAERLPLKS